MRESTVEARLARKVRAMGGECKKLIWPGDDGAPDRMIMMRYGQLWLVETKAPGGKASPLQVLAHEDLRRLGFRVRVLSSNAEVDRFLEEEVRPYAI